MWIAENIAFLPQFFSKQECADFLAKALSLRSITPEESGGKTPFEVVGDFSDLVEIDGMIARLLDAVIFNFPQYEFQEQAQRINSVLKFQRIGELHRVHADADNSMYSSGPTRKDLDKRAKFISIVSSITILNDDYEGGELIFPQHDVSIKLGAGDVIMWPSMDYQHGVNVVTGGQTRYSLVSFWYGKGAVSSVVRAGDS